MDQTPDEIVHTAIDGLLVVLAKSTEDLRACREALAQARLAPLPPFPRVTLIITERIVDDLKRVERDLRDVLVALNLAG